MGGGDGKEGATTTGKECGGFPFCRYPTITIVT